MKKSQINTVTAKALAGQIIHEFNSTVDVRMKKKEAEILSTPMYKKYRALIQKANEFEAKSRPLRKELESKYYISLYDERISMDRGRLKFKVSRETLTDEIILLHNVNGKSIEAIKKELTEKYSK